jgi:hypothetical protein
MGCHTWQSENCLNTSNLERQVTYVHKLQPEGNYCDECEIANILQMLKSTVSKWTMSTKETEWLLAIQLLEEHGNGERNFFNCWT